MPMLSRPLTLALAAMLLAATAATARISDPQMSCAQYLRSGKARSGWPAAVEARIRAFCAANPKMKAIDAEMTVTGD